MDKQNIIRNDSGEIDLNASVASFTKSLRDLINAEVSQAQIDEALDAAFDAHQSRLPKGALVAEATAWLEVHPSQHQAVSLRISKYITSADRFKTVKGSGGGVDRLARAGEQVPAAAKTA